MPKQVSVRPPIERWRATTSQKNAPASFTSRPPKEKGFEIILVFFRANTFALYAALGPTSFAVPTLIQPELPSFQGGKRERFA
jgi:hypothetical protein